MSIKDIIVLAGIVAGAYVIAANFGETTPWGKLSIGHDAAGDSFCSDEELRHMRAGPDACFDPSNLHQTEGEHEPSLKKSTISNT